MMRQEMGTSSSGITKRPHFIPRLLLRRFSLHPEKENPPIWRLSKSTGSASKTSVNNETIIKRANELSSQSELPANFAEDAFSLIEGKAKRVIDRLVDGSRLSAEDRWILAVFLILQDARTPRGREWKMFMLEQSVREHALIHMSDRERVRDVLRRIGHDPSDEEVESWIVSTTSEIETGKLAFQASHDQEVAGMFLGVTELAPLLCTKMSWIALRFTGKREFIISDHPLVR